MRPLYIVTPTNASHVQAAVLCSRRNGMRIRVRSGGHDYEGLSYRSERAEVFAVLDLSNLRAVRVNQKAATAWVDSGATLGELYYAVGKASNLLGFPAGRRPVPDRRRRGPLQRRRLRHAAAQMGPQNFGGPVPSRKLRWAIYGPAMDCQSPWIEGEWRGI